MITAMELSDALAGAVERAAKSVFVVHGRSRLPSTGVHWRGGFIVTANHTVEPDRELTVGSPDGRKVPARLAGREPGLDIAVLKADLDGVPAVEVAEDAAVRIGHLVVAVGAGPRASAGIVSALDASGGRRALAEMLAIDLELYPGFSGGPLVDVLGRVIGITTSGASRHVRCAVRASAVGRLVDYAAQRGRIPRAYLGVGTQTVELPEAVREQHHLGQRSAVIVVDVRPEGPAAAARIVIGDVILSVDGHAIAEPEHLVTVLRPDRVGQRVVVTLLRGGEPREVEVTVGERPHRA